MRCLNSPLALSLLITATMLGLGSHVRGEDEVFEQSVSLLVRNNAPTGSTRSHLTAFISNDDGLTWQGGLLLDERESSYPDGTEGPNGALYVIYDQTRYALNRDGKSGTGSVLLAKFTEADVRAGWPRDTNTKLRTVVTQLRDE